VRANEVVSADQLAAILWPDEPPRDIPNALQTQMSRLRTALNQGAAGDTTGRLGIHGPGYLLRVGPDELDAFVFETASRRSREALADRYWQGATDAADEALALWRGRALDEFCHEPFAEARATQLEERRLLTIECQIDAGLALGRHRQLTGDLQQMVAQHPLREPLWVQLILALYRSGRQSDALRAYERVRRLLADQLGINPCAELVQMERAVLAQDPRLDWREDDHDGGRRAGTGAGSGDDRDRSITDRPITFLFTDVEHSTALWDRDPEAMAEALRLHDTIVRESIEDHAGQVFGRPGDGFCAVFDRAGDAVAATIDLQRRLGAATQTGPDRLRVKAAVHTGDAERREGSYFGPSVSRVARLRDAAHGGQTLVSATTRELLLDALPDDADLRDIGTWLFEGFSRSERVYQVEHPDLADEFPPLRSGRAQTSAIPRNSTSFVGRQNDSEATVAALAANPLVTLTGEGGVGKTRLALEIAQRADLRDYPDGIWFCDLSSLDDPEGLAETVAAALGLATPAGTMVGAELVAHLQRARLLLVIDNCEQLLAAVSGLIEDIVASGSDAKILATSRAPLRVRGEQIIDLEPLALPMADGSDAAEAPAVRLLVDRARAAGAPVTVDDPRLVEIAELLDGVPLAIELAAPRLASMSPAALAARLDRRFELLTGPPTVPERQRTLRATLDWSFNLLSADAQRLFAALSVFRGGWTLDTAELITVAARLDPDAVAPLMAELAEQSMVRVELRPQGTARYRLLETMRVYASEHLAQSGHQAAVAERHAHHFLELAERAARHRRGPLESAWVHELAVEFDNLRAAYRWSIESGRALVGLRLVAALAEDVIMRERLEVGRWAERLAALPEAADEPLRAVALALAGNTAMVEYRLDDAQRLSEAAVAHEQATGAIPPCWIARNTLALLTLAQGSGEFHEELDAMDEISATTGDPFAAAVADYDRVLITTLFGEPDIGLEPAERLLALGTERANPSLLAMGLLSHGRVVSTTEPDLAAREFHDALAVASSAHNTLLVQQCLRAIEEVNARTGQRSASLASLRLVARRFEKSGNVAEQLQTIISMLDALVAMEALVPVATICGALSRTAGRFTAACRVIDRTVADRLPPDDYLAARRAGAAMTPAELIAYATAVVQEVAQ
jgi:predicted ATPase/class 3 adenylate cyclase